MFFNWMFHLDTFKTSKINRSQEPMVSWSYAIFKLFHLYKLQQFYILNNVMNIESNFRNHFRLLS